MKIGKKKTGHPQTFEKAATKLGEPRSTIEMRSVGSVETFFLNGRR